MGHRLLNLVCATTIIMNTFVVFAGLLALAAGSPIPDEVVAAAAPAVVAAGVPFLVRAPAHDSASIEHHRLGGNFAYSTAEAHAFAEVVPQISTLTHPVAETTHTHIPAPIATHQPAPIIKTHHVAQPIFKNVPTYGTQAITGPVRTHRTVHQPIVHETRTHTVHAVAQVPVAVAHAAPVAVAHAAPVAVAHGAYAHAPIAHGAYAVAAAPAVVA